MNNQKGITLIALVITVIVMLILVAVTINIATTGGLFTSARKAKDDTIINAEKDKLISAMKFGNDGYVSELSTNDSEWEKSGDSTNGWTVTNKSTGNKYTISKAGKIEQKSDEETEDQTDIYGTYKSIDKGVGDNVIKIENANTLICFQDEEEITINYSYSQETKIFTASLVVDEEECIIEAYVLIIKDNNNQVINKVLVPITTDGMTFASTNGYVGLDKYKLENAVYIETEHSYTLELLTGTDEDGNEYGKLNDGDPSIYIYLNEYIYCEWGKYQVISDTQIGRIDSETGLVDITYIKQ